MTTDLSRRGFLSTGSGLMVAAGAFAGDRALAADAAPAAAAGVGATATGVVGTGAAAVNAAAASAAAADAPPGLELAMRVTADIADVIPLGASPSGERRIIPITGGHFEGPRLKGIILPGGEDAQFDRADGVTVFEARYWLKTDDGAVIRVVNRALRSLPPEELEKAKRGEPYDRNKAYLRTQPEFEAPAGRHDWLNRAIFVGTLALGGPKQVVLRYFKVL